MSNKELLDNIDILMPRNKGVEKTLYVQRLNENKQILEELLEDGGVTAVVNEDQKVLITVF